MTTGVVDVTLFARHRFDLILGHLNRKLHRDASNPSDSSQHLARPIFLISLAIAAAPAITLWLAPGRLNILILSILAWVALLVTSTVLFRSKALWMLLGAPLVLVPALWLLFVYGARY